jgi:hypothetical protein
MATIWYGRPPRPGDRRLIVRASALKTRSSRHPDASSAACGARRHDATELEDDRPVEEGLTTGRSQDRTGAMPTEAVARS